MSNFTSSHSGNYLINPSCPSVSSSTTAYPWHGKCFSYHHLIEPEAYDTIGMVWFVSELVPSAQLHTPYVAFIQMGPDIWKVEVKDTTHPLWKAHADYLSDRDSPENKKALLDTVLAWTKEKPRSEDAIAFLDTMDAAQEADTSWFKRRLDHRSYWCNLDILTTYVERRLASIEEERSHYSHIKDKSKIADANRRIDNKKVDFLKQIYKDTYKIKARNYDRPPSTIYKKIDQVEEEFTEWLEKHQSEYLTDEVLDQLHQDMHGTTLDDPSDQKPEGMDTKFLLAFFLLAKKARAPIISSSMMDNDNLIYRMVAFLQNEKFDSVEGKGKALKRIIANNETSIGEERFRPLQQVEDRLLAFKEALKTDDEVYLKIQNTIENLSKYYKLK